MGYKQLYLIACDYPGCEVTDTVASEHALPIWPPIERMRNPAPEGWRKFRDTETDTFGTFCPGCSAKLQGRPDLDHLTPLGACPHCSASVYRTPAGLACTNGHGGWVSEELAVVFDNVQSPSAGYAAVPFAQGEGDLPPGISLPGPDYMPAWDQSDGAPDEGSQSAEDAPCDELALTAHVEQPSEEEEATLREAIPEGDMVYALYTDGRIFKKQFHDDSCAKVAAQQLYDIPIEPSKMVTWYQWELCEPIASEGPPA